MQRHADASARPTADTSDDDHPNLTVVRTSLGLCGECLHGGPAVEGACACAVDMKVCAICRRGPLNDAAPVVCGDAGCRPVEDDARQTSQGTYDEGVASACAYLGHQGRLGDQRCVCGLVPRMETPSDPGAVIDRYQALAADAYCAAQQHPDADGRSWRDGTCRCAGDVRAVLDAVGQVAGHIECREVIERLERIRASEASTS